MTLILADIRKEYDVIAAKNRDEAEEWYKRKCSDLEEKSRSNQEELEKVNAEIAEYRNGSVTQNWDENLNRDFWAWERKQVSRLEMELESLRGSNEYLERNLQVRIIEISQNISKLMRIFL